MTRRPPPEGPRPAWREWPSANAPAGACHGRRTSIGTALADIAEGNPGTRRPTVAYFSMEYGLHEEFHTYAGGLGVLGEPLLYEGQREITSYGGWRAYTASRKG